MSAKACIQLTVRTVFYIYLWCFFNIITISLLFHYYFTVWLVIIREKIYEITTINTWSLGSIVTFRVSLQFINIFLQAGLQNLPLMKLFHDKKKRKYLQTLYRIELNRICFSNIVMSLCCIKHIQMLVIISNKELNHLNTIQASYEKRLRRRCAYGHRRTKHYPLYGLLLFRTGITVSVSWFRSLYLIICWQPVNTLTSAVSHSHFIAINTAYSGAILRTMY